MSEILKYRAPLPQFTQPPEEKEEDLSVIQPLQPLAAQMYDPGVKSTIDMVNQFLGEHMQQPAS